MNTVFAQRVIVGLADFLTRHGPSHPSWAKSKMALDSAGYRPDVAGKFVDEAFRGKTEAEQRSLLFRAFWLEYWQNEFAPSSDRALLWINPPDCEVIAPFVYAPGFLSPFTRDSVTILTSLQLSPMTRAEIKGTAPGGFFDEVTVFASNGMGTAEWGQLMALVAPGTVIRFLRPGSNHIFWMQWCGLMIDMEPIEGAINQAFKCREILFKPTPDVVEVVYGLEAR